MQVAFGVTLDGPIGHVWYTFLDGKVFPNEPRSNRAVVCKMLLDQLLWAPFFSCVFFVFTNVLAVSSCFSCGRLALYSALAFRAADGADFQLHRFRPFSNTQQ